ncbi:MAG: hypothetical protein IT233_11820 [Bacteroidia bacterium]|nr:hypothetical protein [Bacteroidia bacterium]
MVAFCTGLAGFFAGFADFFATFFKPFFFNIPGREVDLDTTFFVFLPEAADRALAGDFLAVFFFCFPIRN